MALFDKWCEFHSKEKGRKRLWKLTEKAKGREAIKSRLFRTVRSHYDSLEIIASEVKKLGYKTAARILRQRLPKTKKARSGDLGEILASELVEEKLGFDVPVRRLRYKDGREMALRGDDFIGVKYSEDTGLRLLKGESKSRRTLAETTITQARKTLNRDNGRCTPASLLFVADRLLEREGHEDALGRALRKEVGTKALRPSRIDHVLFTISGNAPPSALQADLDAADEGRNHTVINIRIEDHQEFIADIYEGAGNLGDD
jgi:Cap4 SAVED domain